MKGKHLITTDNWFMAPDGKLYRAVWGDVEIVDDKILGIKTNRISTNWYANVGSKERGIIIAGCQIHYAVRCEEVPNVDKVLDFRLEEKGSREYYRPTEIYLAQLQ